MIYRDLCSGCRITGLGSRQIFVQGPRREAIRLAKDPDTVHCALDKFLEGGLRLWAEVDEGSEVLAG